MRIPPFVLAAFALAAVLPTVAATPAPFLDAFAREARQADTAFAASAARRRAFFSAPPGGGWRCASCHTENPGTPGRHAATGKAISPPAPAANPDRFTSAGTAEQWFRRNGNDVAGRACTAGEKADVLAWLLAAK